ncbi:hypothetical protein CYMTET_54918 [Cymbomonas tetramitiformis]|uniref:Phosphatidate cytidylyltransferase n=1 Tax=Cymbomonas tetramitiformis TaxID=36881 RepID=A0AAE0ENW0_9CHLO|nr:hypothetical protein CYMTET_54918 [Cymbomonas tetramitiformis]
MLEAAQSEGFVITSLVFGLFYCGYLPSFWVRLRLLTVPIDLTFPAGLCSVVTFFTGSPFAAQATVGAGLLCTVLPICCIIAADTCAYLGGKTYGKTPLTQISPNKTVEGLAFGILGSMAVAFLCHCLIAWPASPIIACGLGFMIFLSSVFGDLIESSMKREAGMKDASDFIPGHGGVLDRFDSYLFTGVLVYFFWPVLFAGACPVGAGAPPVCGISLPAAPSIALLPGRLCPEPTGPFNRICQLELDPGGCGRRWDLPQACHGVGSLAPRHGADPLAVPAAIIAAMTVSDGDAVRVQDLDRASRLRGGFTALAARVVARRQ